MHYITRSLISITDTTGDSNHDVTGVLRTVKIALKNNFSFY